MAWGSIHRSAGTWPRQLLVTTALTATALLAAPASAQTLGAAAESTDAVAQDIIVTASRTAQDGLQAPTPTQVLSADVIDKQAATTVMEVLNQNPAFKATR
ncbi:MAG TPA: hypothetical protein VNQ31_03920, partial [Sphingomonadaceae bacterium]|nr:hypothetical protein [Sphingomonadaceae bacterium]